ncbi:MAG TPA: hypothetical protein PKD55_14450 [Bellilinea sp.]|nr:hypothetical protein [Bellilinea sp.]
METPEQTVKPLPQVIKVILQGLELVANKLYLIILPLIVDLVLWLGPKFSIRTLFDPFLKDSMAVINTLNSPAIVSQMTEAQKLWQAIISQFNMLSFLRTIPIGVPSLMTSKPVESNPLGGTTIYEMTNTGTTFLFMLGLLLVGFVLGCIYLAWISDKVFDDKQWQQFPTQTGKALIFVLAVIAGVLIFLMPVVVIVSLLAFFSPFLGEIALFLGLFILLWLLYPLIFTAHGIFSLEQKLMDSVRNSIRIVRSTTPITGLFLILAVLIPAGLNQLWRVPKTDSWFMLVGILGHAFLTTAMFAASFVYFRDISTWLEDMKFPARMGIAIRWK